HEPTTLGPHMGEVNALLFDDAGETLLVGGRGFPEDLLALTPRSTFAQAFPEVLAAAGGFAQAVLTPDGALTLTGPQAELTVWCNPVRRWDLETGQVLQSYRSGSVCSLGWHSGALVSGGQGGLLQWWDVASGESLNAMPAGVSPEPDELTPEVTTTLVFPGGEQVLAVHEGLSLWETIDGFRVLDFEDAPSPACVAARAPDPDMFFTGHLDGSVRLWHRERARPLRTLRGHADEVRGLAFSEQAQLLVSSGDDGRLLLWDFSRLQARSAAEDLERASEVRNDQPHSPSALALLGAVYARRGPYPWAVELLESAQAQGARVDADLLRCARWRAGRWSTLASELSTSSSAPLRSRLADAFVRGRAEAAAALRDGEQAIAQGDPQGALVHATACLEKRGDWGRAWALAGLAHDLLDDEDAALLAYTRALKRNRHVEPLHVRARFFLARGKLRNEREQFAWALADLDRVVELDPARPGMHNERAALLEALERWDMAAAAWTQAIDEQPTDWPRYVRRGNAYLRARRFSEAKRDFDTLYEGEIRNEDVFLGRGRALLDLGDLDGARGHLAPIKEARIEGKSVDQWCAFVGYRVQDLEKIEVRPSWVRFVRKHVAGQVGRGVTLGNFVMDAVAEFNVLFMTTDGAEVRELGLSFRESAYGLARIHARRGEREAALDMLEEAVGAGLKDWPRIHAEADLAALRGHPRYLALMDQAR
ncbi:hypothetical protein OAX78_02110, partial [Planctomycetota bacterium]|nr:hypothetical protein [Planctomycetota bacterium]